MSDDDIFEGCLATNLMLLDLSYNDLATLPYNGYYGIASLADSITNLNLAGNRLRMFTSVSSVDYKNQRQFLDQFQYLRRLNLADNGFNEFNAVQICRKEHCQGCLF